MADCPYRVPAAVRRGLALVFTLLTALSGMSAAAVDTTQSYLFALHAGRASYAAGETVTVTLTLSRTDDEGGFALYAVQDDVHYDTDALELLSVDTSASGFNHTVFDGFVRISAWSSAADGRAVVNPFDLAVLTFRVKDASVIGESEIHSENCLVSTRSGQDSYAVSAEDFLFRVGEYGILSAALCEDGVSVYFDVSSAGWTVFAASYNSSGRMLGVSGAHLSESAAQIVIGLDIPDTASTVRIFVLADEDDLQPAAGCYEITTGD